jgi:three-Cys-motif partner protein
MRITCHLKNLLPSEHYTPPRLTTSIIVFVLMNDVAVPRDTIWPIEPHTAAKHQILRKYLDAWFPILGTYNKRIVYVDGFAGPGRYTGGELGSPLIAMESARTHRANLGGELVFLFIEERADRADHLEGEIGRIQLPAHFKVRVERGTFAEKLGKTLDELDSDGSQIAPTFALIDPFGFSGIPYTLIQRLLSKNRCEVLITFMVDAMNRWLTHPEENIRAHIVETFGTDEAVGIAEGTGDRAVALKNLYHRQLNKAAKFVRYFEMSDRDGRLVYYLFFASNNSTGHLKMKEAMWKVDPLGDFTFSDSTNSDQHILFTSPSTAPLAADLTARFRGASEIPVKRVEAYVQDHTAYLRKHMGEALGQLELDGKLKVAEVKTDGKKRRARTYPNEAVVSFV